MDMSNHRPSSISGVQRKFILHWGEMGTRWGVNRTVAQVHALLYISPAPLNADDLVEALEVARSNVSTSLKELQGWGIVRLVHVQGDKRDHFESLKDVWDMVRIVMDERKSASSTRRCTCSRVHRRSREGQGDRRYTGSGSASCTSSSRTRPR